MSLRIVSLAHLMELPERQFVLVTGCFDILHAGHVQLLEHAFLLGCHVWVGLNSDRAVSELKGPGRPVNPFAHRAKVMSAVRYVEYVFEIDALRVDGAIYKLRPAWWVKGGDYTMETLNEQEVKAAKAVEAEIVLFRSQHDISTSQILRKANEQTPT